MPKYKVAAQQDAIGQYKRWSENYNAEQRFRDNLRSLINDGIIRTRE